uniref:Uncharacterized protein n=1 Tax=Manihot esculenta TaxID=3983 RepID=A0A2C9UWS1_MANES
MALHLFASYPICSFTKQPSRTCSFRLLKIGNIFSPLGCLVSPKLAKKTIVRRSANYQPPIWDFNFVQSLKSEYGGEVYTNRISKLKEEVRLILLKQAVDPLDQLQLIDTLQRLGLAYHFEDEIKSILMSIYSHNNARREDLYATALEFRLLREHGYKIPQEIFNSFQDEVGNFKKCLCEDWEGMLSLYEASFLSDENEDILQNARDFTTTCLRKFVQQSQDQNLSNLVSHALEIPLHWRMLRLETRWFIDVYERKQGMNPLLLELAKLDFNNVQMIHQNDLKHVSRWWRSTGLGEKLSFARDRLMENFFWSIGVIFKPQFSYCRRMLTKVGALLTTIDDIYDVYGTLDELELFTDAVQRWDVNAVEQLPDYMKICYLSLHNTINEIAFDFLREQGIHIVPYLKRADELKRGDVPKSIQCYMHETGASEKEARDHIRFLISETWKEMNEEKSTYSPFSETFISIAFNLARMAQCMYQHGDGHGIEDRETKDRVVSLLVQPIPCLNKVV